MPVTNVQKWLEALEKQRRALKMPLPILAERAQLSRATVCRILKEKRTSSSLKSVLALASVLGAEFELRIQDPEKLVEQQVKRKAGRKARRWVVERTHSWMNRFRGILIRWGKKAENYIALLHMSFAFIIYKRMGLTG